MRRTFSIVLCALATANGACFPARVVVVQTPPIPVVPLTFETNLLSAQGCDYKGTVDGVFEADRLGANLVIAFVINRSSSESTLNGVTTSSRSSSSMNGKAVRCPKHLIDRILAMSPPGEEAR